MTFNITHLSGGRLAEVVGARRVFGGALLGHCLLTLLEPAASYWSINALMVVRVLMGLITVIKCFAVRISQVPLTFFPLPKRNLFPKGQRKERH